jgi:hypothetical protein
MSPNDTKIAFHVVAVEGKLIALHDGQPGIGESRPMAKNAIPSFPKVPNYTDNGTRWAYWGDDDLLPTNMRVKMEAVPIAGAAIAKKINFLQGEDLQFFYKDEFARDGFNATPLLSPEMEDWMEMNRIQTEWWPAQCADFCLPYNCFSELIFTKGRDKIENLYHISAEHARLSKANKANQIDYLVYSYHFPFATAQGDENRVPMPLYRWYNSKAFLEGLQGAKFGWHTRFPTPGLIYYARPWWLGLFKENGWMDVSSNVPRIVNAMQNNQVSLKYMILYPESYFIYRYPNWHSMSADERQKLFNEKQAEITTYLSGPDKAGKTLMSTFRENEHNGAPMGKPEIIAIDDKMKTGTWVPDSNFADSQIVQGLGLDPSQIGLAPEGGSMGSGSGSDKMQSYNQHILLNTPDQRLILEPLTWVANFNKWGNGRKVIAVVKHTQLTTQNENRDGIAAKAVPKP